ncbi:RND superfamily putative drug exporter [Jatrophihabitans sp. GAS493]|uniref:MMPL family transporter n=1 Tax=Jatrophihabitans sp. GAS493 TaxID=1907575 RepID=UPI000BB6BB47|nr:MMPL family transporter [Jatrophihabitans sp. GAS493]SOD70457.1 RND superfamily putative drug exporter [Jatrophihabitans sp. GAS493]
MITALIRRTVSHGRVIVFGAILFGLLAAVVGSTTLSKMTNDSDSPTAESVLTAQRLTNAAGMSADLDIVAIVSPKGGIASTAGRYRVSQVALKFFNDEGVANVQSYLNSNSPALVSKDGKSAIVSVQFKSGVDRNVLAKSISEQFKGEPDVALGGVSVTGLEIGDRVAGDLSKAELFALPLLFLLALWIFRGVVAATVTIGIGVLAIVTTLMLLRGVVEITSISSYVLNLVTGLGLGLAIDYCLFIMSRYREETVLYGYTPRAALAAGMAAGRTVIFSALTVAASMSALMLFPQKFLFSMGVGGALVTLVSATVSIIVLPAALVLLGHRIDSLTLPGSARARRKDTGHVHKIVWYRLAKWVMRHAKVVLVASLILVATLAWPALSTRFSNINVNSLPTNSVVRTVSERVASEFPNSGGTTINVAVEAPKEAQAEVTTLAQRVAKVPHVVVPAAPVFLGSDTWSLSAVVFDGPFSQAAENALHDIRELPSPNKLLVGGETAAFVDNEQSMLAHLPMAALVVAIAVMLVIFLLTGSVVLPVKTLLVNILNVSMTIGVLVWIFQWGHLEGPLHFQSTGAIDLSQPILVAVIGFGLSTDYGVFLMARIKESYDHDGDNVEAVATGVGRSGRIISSAALLLCVAVGAFSTSSVLFIKQLGVGTAVAVLLDATIIRAFLVPSAMRLMSTANWWAPAPLRRFHDRYGVTEGGPVVVPDGSAPKLVLIPSPPPAPAPQLTLVRSPAEPAPTAERTVLLPPPIVRQPAPPEITGEQPAVTEPRRHRRIESGGSTGKHRHRP